MSSIFTKIINGEIPSIKIYEDDICIVIMDKFPSIDGQSLVIPKQEVEYIFDLPNEVYEHLFKITKKVAKASDEAFATLRTCVVIEGFEVPHAHIKIYPVTAGGKTFSEKLQTQTEKYNDTLEIEAEKIKACL